MPGLRPPGTVEMQQRGMDAEVATTTYELKELKTCLKKKNIKKKFL